MLASLSVHYCKHSPKNIKSIVLSSNKNPKQHSTRNKIEGNENSTNKCTIWPKKTVKHHRLCMKTLDCETKTINKWMLKVLTKHIHYYYYYRRTAVGDTTGRLTFMSKVICYIRECENKVIAEKSHNILL